MSPLFVALLGGLAAYCIFIGWWRKKQAESKTEALRQRLREFRSQSELDQSVMQASGTVKSKDEGFVSRMGTQLASALFDNRGGLSLLDNIEERLVLGGHPHGWHATDYVAVCALSIGGAIVGGGLFVQMGVSPMVYLMLVGLVAMYCHWELTFPIKKRQEQAFAELPYFLDEIIISLSSGSTTLDQAIREVVMSPQNQSGMSKKERVLVTEFRRAYQETATTAKPFREAYMDASKRIQVPAVEQLIELLIEGNQSGAPILDALRDMSKHVYTVFASEMEALIKKKDTTFTIATVLMLVGSFIVIITPIIITVMEALGGGIN